MCEKNAPREVLCARCRAPALFSAEELREIIVAREIRYLWSLVLIAWHFFPKLFVNCREMCVRTGIK